MKKLILIFIAAFFLLGQASAQFSTENLTVYGGIGIIPVSTTDFVDFHISDWENYGLGTSEGRVAVPLSANTPGSSFGIQLGADYGLTEKLSAVLDLNYALSGISVTQLMLGVNFAFVKTDNFSIGITPKIGYTVASAEFGAIEVLPNKTPPVILPEGTFYEGDLLSMEMSGLSAQIGATVAYDFSEMLGVYANANYGLSFGTSGSLMAGELEIPMTANGVVKDDFSSTQAGIEPNAKIQGLGFAIGIRYIFNN